MTVRKLDEYLDLEESGEDNDQGYDSEAAEERKGGRTAVPDRLAKRQRTSNDAQDDDNDTPTALSIKSEAGEKISSDEKTILRGSDDGSLDKPTTSTVSTSSTPRKRAKDTSLKPLTASRLAASQRDISRTGVIYLSRIPPFMKPTKLRSLLTPYGALNRIFLSPEDTAARIARVRAGGNKKPSFVDGWVEFVNKKDAKLVVESLNAQNIGGRKGNFYYDDVWNMKYLKGFKWHNLTEQIANENAERVARLRVEIDRGKKGDREFVRNIERGKMFKTMQEKRAKKAERAKSGGKVEDAPASVKTDSSKGSENAAMPSETAKRYPRQYRQNAVVQKGVGTTRQPDEVKRVLGKIF